MTGPPGAQRLSRFGLVVAIIQAPDFPNDAACYPLLFITDNEDYAASWRIATAREALVVHDLEIVLSFDHLPDGWDPFYSFHGGMIEIQPFAFPMALLGALTVHRLSETPVRRLSA